jgi:hypothetical protein
MVVGAPLNTRDTVLWDTPVARATSIIVGAARAPPERLEVRVLEPFDPSPSSTGLASTKLVALHIRQQPPVTQAPLMTSPPARPGFASMQP